MIWVHTVCSVVGHFSMFVAQIVHFKASVWPENCSCAPGRTNNHVIRLVGLYYAVSRTLIGFRPFCRLSKTEAR